MSFLVAVESLRQALVQNGVPPMADGSYTLVASPRAAATIFVAAAGKPLTKRRLRRMRGKLRAG